MLEERITELVKNRYQKRVEEASDKELYEARCFATPRKNFPDFHGSKERKSCVLYFGRVFDWKALIKNN